MPSAEYQREWKRRNPGKQREYSRRDCAKKRQMIFDAYGNICACCGETEPKFLSIDHVNGGGIKHRKSRGAHRAMLDIVRAGFPADYRLLCHNCNQALGFYGTCPHSEMAVAT